MVNHEARLYKLEAMGVGGKVLNIFWEFLMRRSQRVTVDRQLSVFFPMLSGVPQGSVLDPLVFILFTSDMWHSITKKYHGLC